jgi:hypothetical protein
MPIISLPSAESTFGFQELVVKHFERRQSLFNTLKNTSPTSSSGFIPLQKIGERKFLGAVQMMETLGYTPHCDTTVRYRASSRIGAENYEQCFQHKWNECINHQSPLR